MISVESSLLQEGNQSYLQVRYMLAQMGVEANFANQKQLQLHSSGLKLWDGQ